MFLGARLIVPLIYGPSYREAVPVFAVLGLAMVLFFVNALPGNIIQNSPKVTRFLPLAGVNLVIVAILGCLLIPRWSVMGAAWTVVGGEMTGLVINNWFVWQTLKSRN